MELGTDQATFFDVDAHAILSLPTRGAGDDSWAWELERHGHSVRSAYRLLFDDQWRQLEPGHASPSGDAA